MRRAGEQKLLSHVRQNRITLHGEHLRKRWKGIRIEATKSVANADFHWDGNHRSGQHGCEEGREFVHQE